MFGCGRLGSPLGMNFDPFQALRGGFPPPTHSQAAAPRASGHIPMPLMAPAGPRFPAPDPVFLSRERCTHMFSVCSWGSGTENRVATVIAWHGRLRELPPPGAKSGGRLWSWGSLNGVQSPALAGKDGSARAVGTTRPTAAWDRGTRAAAGWCRCHFPQAAEA